MLSLRLQRVSFAYDGLVPVLSDVSLHLSPGWTGLVGPNGAGKSTLLRILDGSLPCDGVTREPAELVVHRMEQRLDAPSDAVNAFAVAWDKAALRLMSRLDLDPMALDRWTTLSPGERRRWQVAAARWRAPDVLLLDEPDNHLDAEAMDALIDALKGLRGIGVVVSHDRSLLDALTTRTVRVDGDVRVVDLPYSEAEAVWQAESQALLDALDAANRQRRTARRQLNEAHQRASAATRSRSLRGVSPRDHDARSTARKSAAQKGEAALHRSLGRAKTAAARAEHALADAQRPTDLGRSLHIEHTATRHGVVASFRGPLVAGERTLANHLDIQVLRGERVWLRGANGAGKSTLLRALVARSPVAPARQLVLPQELDEPAIDALVATLNGLPPDRRGCVLSVVAALGVDPARLLATARPSPGEGRKLALAMGLADDRALLVLDEPTHHLDLPARMRLQRALASYPGTLMLVTHDRALGGALCSRVIDMGSPR